MNLLGVKTFWQAGVIGLDHSDCLCWWTDQVDRLVRINRTSDVSGGNAARHAVSEGGNHEDHSAAISLPVPHALGGAAATGTLSSTVFAQAKKPTIAFFVKNVTNPFWKACRIGAEKAAKALNVDRRESWRPPSPTTSRSRPDSSRTGSSRSRTLSCSCPSTTRRSCRASRRPTRPAFRSSTTTTR